MADNTDHDENEHDLGAAEVEDNAQPYKLRMTVPPVDVSVIQWLDAQRNTSQSLRQLIRESIQRDGFVDVYYKPVEQLPRRGRPPLTETNGSTDADIDTDTDDAVTSAQDAGAAAAEGMREIGRRVRDAIPDAYRVPAPAAEAPEPELEPVPVPAAPAAQGQIDMDSMFNQRD